MAITHSDGTVSHTGLVIGHGRTTWNDSMDITSYYAQVWNTETGKPEHVYAYHDFYLNPGETRGHYEIDATPEVVAAYETHVHLLELARIEAEERRIAARVEKGKAVKVVKGRKVPVGTIGEVFWIGDNGYGVSVGIICADGSKHFTAITNVQVTTVDETVKTAIIAVQAASKAAWKASKGYTR